MDVCSSDPCFASRILRGGFVSPARSRNRGHLYTQLKDAKGKLGELKKSKYVEDVGAATDVLAQAAIDCKTAVRLFTNAIKELMRRGAPALNVSSKSRDTAVISEVVTHRSSTVRGSWRCIPTDWRGARLGQMPPSWPPHRMLSSWETGSRMPARCAVSAKLHSRAPKAARQRPHWRLSMGHEVRGASHVAAGQVERLARKKLGGRLRGTAMRLSRSP
jgi:hypothetical protein